MALLGIAWKGFDSDKSISDGKKCQPFGNADTVRFLFSGFILKTFFGILPGDKDITRLLNQDV